MGKVQEIVGKYDIMDPNGFAKAMIEMSEVSEGELRFLALTTGEGHSSFHKQQYAIARAELEARSSNQQLKLAQSAGRWGFGGVVIGAILQGVLTWLLTIPAMPAVLPL